MKKVSRLSTALVSVGIVAAVVIAARQAEVALRTFERNVLVENTEENSAGVSVGDLNRDGWPDIVLGKGHHTPLRNRVLLNDRKGGFEATDLGDAPDRTYSAALADIDQDGDLDIIVSNDMPDRKPIYKNDGSGRFTSAGWWGEPSWPTRHLTIADLNGDRYPDLVAANAGARLPLPIPFPSFMCLNDRTGAFPSCRPLPSESAVRIRAADFDGNATIDLFVPHRDGGRNFILWNDGTGFLQRTSFRQRTSVGSAISFVRVADIGDFNSDGRPDVVVGDSNTKAAFVFLNAGGQSFREPLFLPTRGREPFAMAVADLNRDGKPDVVLGYYQSPGSVFFNSGDGHTFTEVPWDDGKGVVDDIAFGDFDQDGWFDIVAARTGAPNAIWFNTRPGSGR